MDFKISSKIWNTKLPSAEKTVLLALDHSGDSDGFSWQGYDKLADMTGISKESKYLTRILNKLEREGHILIWRQHGHKGGRGYTHIYWPIIGRTDEQILEVTMRRFIATEEEARAIISQSGPIYDELVKRNRISGKILEDSRAIKKGVPQNTYNNEKGVLDDTLPDEKVYQDAPIIEADDKKGVLGTPRSKDSLNKESNPIKESKELSPSQKMFLALAEICRINLKSASDKQRGQLGTASKALVNLVTDLDQFKEKFPNYWTQKDWRSKQDQPPTPPQIQEVYGDYCYWLENGQSSGKNGTYPPNKSSPLSATVKAQIARLEAESKQEIHHPLKGN